MKKIGVGENEKDRSHAKLKLTWQKYFRVINIFWLKNKMIWDNFAETTFCQIRRFGSGCSIAVEHTTSYTEDFLLFTSFQVPLV